MSDKAVQQTEADQGAERDTLPTLDRVYLREHLEAALAAGTAQPAYAASGAELEDDEDGRVTEPSLDTMLLRDALLAVGNNHGQ